MSGGYLQSGDLERLFGVTQRQAESWREIGLVVPGLKSPGGGAYRYTPADVRRVRLVKALQRAGLSVIKIQTLIPEVALEVEAIVAEVVSAGHHVESGSP